MSFDAKPILVLVVGQTPPPQHGQAIMIQMLVDGSLRGIKIQHLRMAFSDNMDQVGRFQIQKVFHLFYLIAAIYWRRIRFGAKIFYYPPSGPNRIPLIRDTLLLLSTRWLFQRTVFHFQASGVSELIATIPKWQQFLACRALGRADAAIQLSPQAVPDAEYLKAKRIYYVPNASKDYAISRPSSSLVSDRNTRLLYLGTVCETKGILVLLDALRKLISDKVAVQLDIVGSFQPAEFETSVKDRIEQLGLTPFVTVHGQKVGDEKWDLFANADIFCFPSYYESEGFPCVLVEAMCFSLPIVSTYWRGIPAIVENGKTGFLVETKDSDGLALRIAELISDRSLCDRFGAAARQRFEQEFTSERYLESMTKVLTDVSQ